MTQSAFQSLRDTTGVASDGTTLYVATGSTLKMLGNTISEKKLPYTWIGGISVGDKVYGVCMPTATTNAIFSMTKTSPYRLKKVDVSYIPINIVYTENFKVTVIDSTGKIYTYDNNLAAKDEYEFLNLPSDPYRHISMIDLFGYPLIAYDKKTMFGPQEDLVLDKTIYSMASGNNVKWVISQASGREYKIQGYDFQNKKVGNVIPGGSLPETQMYACVHKKHLYISSSINKVVSAKSESNWSFPTWWWSWSWSIRDLKSFVDHDFQAHKVTYDPIETERKLEAIVLEKKPTEKKLTQVYLWIGICAILLLILAGMLSGYTPSFLYVMLFLTGSVLFLITPIL